MLRSVVGTYLPTFRHSLYVSSSGVKRSKTAL